MGVKSERTTVRWIIKNVKGRIPALAVMLVSYVGSSLLGVVFALASSRVVDTAVAGDRGAFLRACLVQLAVIAGIIICITVYRHLKDRLTADLDRDWKRSLLHRLLHGEYEAVAAYHSGELINRLNNDVRILNDGIVTLLPNASGMIVRLAAAIGVLAALDLRFTLCLAAVGAVLIVVTGLMRGRLKSLNREVSEHEGKVLGFLQETLENLLVVQAMDVAGEMEKRSATLMEARYQVQRRRKNVTLFANTAISIMSYAATFIALVWCSAGVMNGAITFGTLVAITQLVAQLRAPLVNMSGIMPKYAAMTAAAERLMELEAVQPADDVVATFGNSGSDPSELVADCEPAAIYEKMTTIRGENMTFAYDRETILEDASFVLPKGQFAAVTGPSGTGKSTLLKLILGIFAMNRGNLYIEWADGQLCDDGLLSQAAGTSCADTSPYGGGQPAAAGEPDGAAEHSSPAAGTQKLVLSRATRGLFAYVPQKNLLFSGSILENLTVVKPSATDDEIAHAVHVSCMDEFMDQLPQGLATVIGENAAGLSEGQAQRLAIARAVLGGAPVLLLDECTSALDPETERTVLKRIKSLPGRTCIAVTHRPAALEICDLQLNMEAGKINIIYKG